MVGRRGTIGSGVLRQSGFWWERLMVVGMLSEESLDMLDKAKVFLHLKLMEE